MGDIVAAPASTTPVWWKEGVCYQVWPLSFCDGNNDGNGDIRGVISKIDYLHDLGVDYIWMSPMYKSPRHDYGYDVADYESVDPTFGTLADIDELIAELGKRGMKLVLDLVVNHTSSEHHWFKESRKSRDGPYSNYYIWRDGKVDAQGKKHPPNNWKGLMAQESAWVYAEERDQWYLHLFLQSMPDLNWEDPEVRKAIYASAVEFWLKRGVAGFRVDVVSLYSKDQSFPDAPITDPTEEFQQIQEEFIVDGPGMHPWLQEQRKVMNKYGADLMLVGEAAPTKPEQFKKYLDPTNRELDMVFDFEIYRAGGVQYPKPWELWEDLRSLTELRKALTKPQASISELGFWATSFFENHDQPRSTNKFGSSDPKFFWQSAKLLALLLASMSGTLFIYQGQEIGMSNIPRSWPRSELRDPVCINFLEEADRKYPDNPAMREKARDIIDRIGRDHARTPVQWSPEEPYAGFSTVKPWMRVNENFREGINVKEQLADKKSLRSFWKDTLEFRKEWKGLMVYGFSRFVDSANEHVLSVVKVNGGGTGIAKDGTSLLIVMNYSDEVRSWPGFDEKEVGGKIGRFLFGTTGSSKEVGVELQPWEGRVCEVSSNTG